MPLLTDTTNQGTSRARSRSARAAAALVAAASLVAAACGGDDADTGSEAVPGAESTTPTVLVTTGIWADVVANVACGGLAQVETIIPTGGDPHGYEPSLQDRARMENASLIVANGLDLEEGLEDTLEAVAASGVPVFEFAEGMDTIALGVESDHGDEEEEAESDHGDEDEEEGHDEDGDEDEEEGHDEDGDEDEEEGHDEDEDHGDDDEGHGHGGDDPHVWFDPHRVSGALPRLARTLTADGGLDAAAVDACLSSYQAELEAADAEIAAEVAQLPAESRKLVTNHEALGYFADRYGFEVIGTVIPTPASMAQTNPAQLEELAEIIEHEGIKALFAEALHTLDDVEALAARVGDVEVVTLYTGSLGPPGSGAETYVGFLRTNTALIVDALG